MCDTPNMRKHSSEVVDGIEAAPARAMLRAVGFTDDDFNKPQIGIASTCYHLPTSRLLMQFHGAGTLGMQHQLLM